MDEPGFSETSLWTYKTTSPPLPPPLPPPSSSSSSVSSQTSIDLFQSRLIVPSEVFQVAFVQSVYNSALFLPYCRCSFLFHVVTNLFCIFLVSRQMVLLSGPQITLILFVVKKRVYPAVFYKISYRMKSIDFIPFFLGSKFHSHIKE